MAVSKWDLEEEKNRRAPANCARSSSVLLPQLKGAPLIPVSGLTGQGARPPARGDPGECIEIWNRRVPTARLNEWLGRGDRERTRPRRPPGRRIKLRFMTQVKSRPPSFVALEKLNMLRERVGEAILLEVDGGVNAATVRDCAAAGARLFVVGSAIFKAEDYRAAVAQLQELATVAA